MYDLCTENLIPTKSTIRSGYYLSSELSYSQYLALIILLYKKGIREKINNWRPISLNNTDIKILSKTLAERLKIVLPEIIDVDQSGCIKDRKN